MPSRGSASIQEYQFRQKGLYPQAIANTEMLEVELIDL
jgi:hypothetical protein